MSTLRELQQNFQAYILENNPEIETAIVGSDHDFRMLRLDIYRDGYVLRLLEALETSYPILKHLMGDEQFERMGRGYIQQYPSHHFSIRCYSGQLSHYLSTLTDSDPIWIDMARFEWSLCETLDAADAPQLTFAQIATIAPDAWASLKLVTHPSRQLIELNYAVPDLWLAVQQQREQPLLSRQDPSGVWLIWRFQQRALFRQLSKEQLWMLQSIEDNKPFAEICEGLCEWLSEDKVVNFAAETLRGWIDEGMIAEYRL